jgi:HEAT repeat protein/glucose/arabinose dehydrogenase
VKFSIVGGAALAILGGTALLLPAQPPPQWVKMTGQGQNDPRLKGFSTPEGLKLEIVAEAPTVVNPVGMAFADDGTLYVVEWLPGEPVNALETVRYKDGSMRAFPVRKKQVKDRVKRLHDSKGNGTYGQAEVVLEDELPSAILPYDGWLYVAGRGTVRRYKPSKPDGPYDVREVIARGFCADGTRQVSGLALGNDGFLYISSGGGDNVVEGSDGSRATVLGTGGVFRCRPDGSHVEVYSAGYVNSRGGVAFDAGFNAFLADDGGLGKFDSHRLLHVLEGSNLGGRVQAEDQSARQPPVLETRRGPAAALLCYNDTRLPEPYRGLLYYPNPEGAVRAYHVEPDGATFAVTETFYFLTSDQEGFHPSQALTGPDGAVYVCDTGTYLGADRLGGDGEHGRIYRVSWAGTNDQPALPLRGLDGWAKIEKMSEQELLDTLAAPDFSDRQRAQRALVRKGEAVRPALLKLVRDADQPLPARIAAVGALQSFWNDDVRAAFIRLLDDGEPDLRRLAADGLALNCKPGDEAAHHALLQVLGDPNLAVRRAVALAMGRIGADGAADDLVNALSFDEGKDASLRDGLVRAIERLGKPGIDRLLALAESGDRKNLVKVVETFEDLRTRPGADAVPALLKYPHLSVAQRTGLVRSYGNYQLDPPLDLEPLMGYLLANRDEARPVKLAGLEVVALDGTARGPRAEAWLLSLLDETDPGVRLALIKAVAATHLVKAVPPLLGVLRDPARPVGERVAVAQALRAFGKEKGAVAALKDALQGGPAELRDEARRTLAVIDPPPGEPSK